MTDGDRVHVPRVELETGRDVPDESPREIGVSDVGRAAWVQPSVIPVARGRIPTTRGHPAGHPARAQPAIAVVTGVCVRYGRRGFVSLTPRTVGGPRRASPRMRVTALLVPLWTLVLSPAGDDHQPLNARAPARYRSPDKEGHRGDRAAAGQAVAAPERWPAMSDCTGRAPSWLPWSVVLTATLLLVGSAAYVGSSLGQSALAPGMAEIVPSCLPLVVRAAVGGPCAADPWRHHHWERRHRCCVVPHVARRVHREGGR